MRILLAILTFFASIVGVAVTVSVVGVGAQTPIANGSACAAPPLGRYQEFANTNASPTGTTLNFWDGTQCVPWARLNETIHAVLLLAGGAVGSPNSVLLSGGGGAAMTWSAPCANCIFYSSGGNVPGWSATPQFGVNGSYAGSLQLNGATTDLALLSVSATGGHPTITGGVAPTLTAGCNGAGSSVSGNDVAGTVTGQTAAATTCTLTFGTAFGSAPNCVAMGQSSPLTGAATPGTGTFVVNFGSTANYKFSYLCLGT